MSMQQSLHHLARKLVSYRSNDVQKIREEIQDLRVANRGASSDEERETLRQQIVEKKAKLLELGEAAERTTPLEEMQEKRIVAHAWVDLEIKDEREHESTKKQDLKDFDVRLAVEKALNDWIPEGTTLAKALQDERIQALAKLFSTLYNQGLQEAEHEIDVQRKLRDGELKRYNVTHEHYKLRLTECEKRNRFLETLALQR